MIGGAVLARLKQACRAGVRLSGGVEGAAATCGKSTSTAGNWNNRNMADTPTLADAFALDEVAVMQGHRPPIASALVAELGGVLIMLPDVSGDAEALAAGMVQATAEFGDVAQALVAGMADGDFDQGERREFIQQIDEAQAALAGLRMLAAGEGVRVVQDRETDCG